MSQEDAEKEAIEFKKLTIKQTKKGMLKDKKEHKRKWEKSLQSDNDMFALDNLSDEDLEDYFNQ